MSIGKLAYGLSNEVPEDATSAWGCRAILEPGGHVDMLPDRMDRQGSDAIFDELAAFSPDALQAKVKELMASGQIDPRRGALNKLYESDTLTVVASTNGSYGYLYVAAWTKEGA